MWTAAMQGDGLSTDELGDVCASGVIEHDDIL